MIEIEWSDPAIGDLQQMYEFISRDSQHYADRFLDKLVQSVEKVAQFPRIGRRVPESSDEFIREVIYGSYRIIYRVETNRVLVLAVIHSGRDVGSIKPWEVS